MYRLMIVDDDKNIRERLVELLTPHAKELALVCEASQGEEALDLFETERPHIVITDINIPLVDGLELARRIRTQDADVQIIIITGYGTLDFAKEAIKTGTVDFLLKPLKAEELSLAVQKAMAKLNEKTAALVQQANMETLLKESMPLLQERYLAGLVTQAPRETAAQITKHLEKLQIPVVGSCFFICVITPDYIEIDVKDWEVFEIALSNITTELALERKLPATITFDTLMRGIVLVQGSQPSDACSIEEMLLTMKDKLRFYYPFNFSAAVGRGVPSLSELHVSYESALEAIDYRMIYGSNSVVNAENVYLLDKPTAPDWSAEQDELQKNLKQDDRDRFNECCQRHVGHILAASGGTVAQVQRDCIRLLAQIAAESEEVRRHEDEIYTADPYARILNSIDARQAIVYLVDACMQIFDYLHNRRARRSHYLVEQAKTFISANLHNPELSLSETSDHVGLSNVYFCSLFKTETGINFSEYLNRNRVNKAKELLRTTHMKAYEVALAVGYANPSYFFEVFKKFTGQRPRAYAENPDG